MRQCRKHKSYTTDGSVQCKLHGLVSLSRCSGCVDFVHVPRGLGDTIHDVLAAGGITPERVEAVTGQPCNCPEMQAWLNDKVPYDVGAGR